MRTWFTVILLATNLAACSHIPALSGASRGVAQQSCQPQPTKKQLTLTYPQKSSLSVAPLVTYELEQNKLHVRFDVAMDPTHINAKKKLAAGEYPYQFDVVELFLRVQEHEGDVFSYYEFELSPYNENFQVQIDSNAGKKKFTNNINAGIETAAAITENGWVGELRIPLENLKWNGRPESLIGNAFAVLGKGPSRSYWSASLPPQKKPNFHLPEYFRPLINCEP